MWLHALGATALKLAIDWSRENRGREANCTSSTGAMGADEGTASHDKGQDLSVGWLWANTVLAECCPIHFR